LPRTFFNAALDTDRLSHGRDGIEPPTPAFSGLLIDTAKWFEISGSTCVIGTYKGRRLGPVGMIWAIFAPSMFPYCSPVLCWVLKRELLAWRMGVKSLEQRRQPCNPIIEREDVSPPTFSRRKVA